MSRDVGQAVEVQFPLQQLEPGWPPTTVEAIWCLPTPDEDGHYRVTNVPIHVIGVSRDDVVRARRGAAGPMEFVEVTARGGRSTLRVIAAELMDTDAVAEELRATGAVVQNTYISQLLAVDVPADVDFGPIHAWLVDAEANGRLEWEEGHLAEGHVIVH